MKSSLPIELVQELAGDLSFGNQAFQQRYPGESGARQPVHTVYGGAHLFKADTAPRMGELALGALAEYAPDAAAFAGAVGLDLPSALAQGIYQRVIEKLRREPVEDYRLDFEDGYGNRPDAEEDGHAVSAADEVAAALAAGALPPFIGIRIKPLNEELRARSIRTLDLFLTRLADKTGSKLPKAFVVTLAKVTVPEQVSVLARLLEQLEKRLGLAAGSLKLELMVETPQALVSQRGECALPLLLDAAQGRCKAAHFGTYDYTAGCAITAAYQHMLHPACDFARQLMQVALAGTGVWLSDGATHVLPVPIHLAQAGASLTAAQREENRSVIHRSWKLHYCHVRHSLENAYYQGWDLHPAQLPTRFAAVYAFFLESLEAASERLRNFVARAAQATLVGEVFDDAATGQGLLNFFLRAINCGAIPAAEVTIRTGLSPEELRLGSFLKILNGRRGRLVP